MSGLVLLSVIGAEALSGYLYQKGSVTSIVAFAGLAGLLLFVGYDPTRIVLREHAASQQAPWDPSLIDTINQHSKPGDYILTTEGPLLYVVTNRKNPLLLNFFVDEVLPYVTTGNRSLRMANLREALEKHLPKVCYFPATLRYRQDNYHQLLFDPLLLKYNYTKVNDFIWYLPAAK
ncbi:MAG: hypothetical protein WAO00_03430 [Chthoniobacterales bacterium]